MWSYVGKKDNPRWLWHAIDHHSGKVLAYVFGRRKDEVFSKRSGAIKKRKNNRQNQAIKLGSFQQIRIIRTSSSF